MKKTTVKKKSEGKTLHDSPDALITVTAALPGLKPTQFNVRIVNFRGNTIGEKRTIENMERVIQEAFRQEFGGIVR